MFSHFSESVCSLSIPKYILLFSGAILLAIKSSPFSIRVVSFGMYLVRIPEINSVCAFRISESLNKFVHTKYVGVKYGYTFGALLSSTSNTAKSFFAFPIRFAPLIRVVVIPASMFEPYLLSINT